MRPIMSAPTPRAGSSGRAVSTGSSPATMAAASRGSVPGMEPTPVAAPSGQRAGGAAGSSSGSGPELWVAREARPRPAGPRPARRRRARPRAGRRCSRRARRRRSRRAGSSRLSTTRGRGGPLGHGPGEQRRRNRTAAQQRHSSGTAAAQQRHSGSAAATGRRRATTATDACGRVLRAGPTSQTALTPRGVPAPCAAHSAPAKPGPGWAGPRCGQRVAVIVALPSTRSPT